MRPPRRVEDALWRPLGTKGLPRPRSGGGAGPSVDTDAHAGAGPAPLPDWPSLIGEVFDDPERLNLLFQPIVSFAEASIVGYETLARFASPSGMPAELAAALTPDQWFLAADELGQGAAFEALVIARCLDLRGTLPPDCFLTFNVSPHLITDPSITNLLLAAGPLQPLIVEFTEHRNVPDLAPLVRLRDQLSDRGGLLALDDAGSGYSGLQQMTRLRPHLIKLDRALVTNADRDEVKLALAELLGEFAGRIDAWLLAEGVETWAEFDAFARIGVPLGQGFLFGRPAPPWAKLDPEIAARLRVSGARVRLTEHVASLIEPAWVSEELTAKLSRIQAGRIGLQLDGERRPTAIFIPLGDPDLTTDPQHAGHREAPVSMRVAPSDDVIGIVQRLMTRSGQTRFDPLVCIDERGQALGIVRVERLVMRLLELKSSG